MKRGNYGSRQGVHEGSKLLNVKLEQGTVSGEDERAGGM